MLGQAQGALEYNMVKFDIQVKSLSKHDIKYKYIH